MKLLPKDVTSDELESEWRITKKYGKVTNILKDTAADSPEFL
jgi:hypothetical protein